MISTTGRTIEAGLYLLLLLTPLAFGGVEFWARGLFQIVAGAVILAWLVRRLDPGRGAPAGGGARALFTLWAAVSLFILLVLLQLLPLPPAVLRSMSPATHALYGRSLPGYLEGDDFHVSGLVPWLLQGESTPLSSPPLEAAGLETTFPASRPLSIYAHATSRQLMLLVCLIGLFAAVADYFRTRERFVRLMAAIALSGFAVSLIGVIQKLTWNGKLYWVRDVGSINVFGPFVNRNSYAAFAGTILPIALCGALGELRRASRGRKDAVPALALWGFVMVLIAGGVLMSLSRGGILAAALSVVVVTGFLVYFGTRRVEIGLVVVLLLLCGALLVWLGPGMVVERVGTLAEGTGVPSLVHRYQAWSHAARLVADHPVLGTGLGTFRFAFLRYAPPGEGWWTTAHNEYLELVCDTGALGGALALIGSLAFALRVARPSLFKERRSRYFYAGLVAGLVGLLVHAGATSSLHVPANGLLAAVVAGALLALVRRHEVAPSPGLRRPVSRWAGRSCLGIAAALFLLDAAAGVRQIAGFALRRSGETALASGDLDAAFDSLRSAVRWEPGESSGRVLLGRVVQQAMAGDAAPRALEGRDADEVLGAGLAAVAGAVALNPADTWGWFNVANVYQGHRSLRVRRLEMVRAARPAPERAGATEPEPPPGRPDDAASADTLAEALEALEEEAERAGGGGEDARRLIRRSLERVQAGGPAGPARIPPGRALAAESPASRGGRSLDPEDVVAVAAAAKALELEPESHAVRDFLAGLYWARGRRAEAAAMIGESLARVPRLAEHGLLDREELVADLAGALLEGLERAERSPFADRVEALRARAGLLARLARDQEAIEVYGRMRDEGDALVQAECDLSIGRLEQRRGEHEASLEPLRRAATRVRAEPYATLALFHLGVAHARLGRGLEAVALLQEHLRRAPGSMTTYLELAGEQEKLGRAADAERLLLAAVRRFPRRPEPYRRLIGLLTRAGRREEAGRYAEALLELEVR